MSVVTSPPRALRTSGVLAVPASALLGNLLAYAGLLAGARVLDHAHFGSFVTLTTMMGVGAVPSLAVQAVAARRTARSEPLTGLGRLTALLAVATAALVGVLAPVLDTFLHVDSLAATLWLAAGLAPLTLSGLPLGVVQGSERLVAFAGLSLLQALGRFGGVLVPLALGANEAGAMAGGALATAAMAAIAMTTTRHQPTDTTVSARRDLLDVGHAMHGYAAILVLVSLDLLLARHVLTSDAAAQYAAGSVVTKVVVWLPQSVGLIVFARLAVHERGGRVVRRAAAVVVGVGLVVAAGTWLFGGLAATVVGGDFPIVASSGWVFALLGTSLALLQFTAVAGLARAESRRLAPLWLAAAGEVAVAAATGRGGDPRSLVAMLAALVGVVAVGALVGAARSA